LLWGSVAGEEAPAIGEDEADQRAIQGNFIAVGFIHVIY
jgi:hypothetical protein